jgi:hypothetical protein
LDKLRQAFLQVGSVLDVDTDVREGLLPVKAVRTTLADKLVGNHTAECVLKKIGLRGLLKILFQSIVQHAPELMDVHLHVDIDGLAIPTLKGLYKDLRIVRCRLQMRQIQEDLK